MGAERLEKKTLAEDIADVVETGKTGCDVLAPA